MGPAAQMEKYEEVYFFSVAEYEST